MNLLPICSPCNKSMGIIDMNVFVLNNFPENHKDFQNRTYNFKKESKNLFSFLP